MTTDPKHIAVGWNNTPKLATSLGPWSKQPTALQNTVIDLFTNAEAATTTTTKPAKFTPPAGRVISGSGQYAKWNTPLFKAMPPELRPASTLIYLSLNTNSIDKEIAQYKGLFLDATLFFQLPGVTQGPGVDIEVAAGHYDAIIAAKARSLRDFGGPVLLRPGSEFNGSGPDWSNYHQSHYAIAYRRTVQIFRDQGATNVAFCWCYSPVGPVDFMAWYPGEDVIDWFGVDVFSVGQFTLKATLDFLAFARSKNKPVSFSETSNKDVPIQNTKWGDWFEHFFAFLEAHPEIVKFNYVSADWSTTSYGPKGWKNGHLPDNPAILAGFIAEMRKPRYLHAQEIGALAP